LGRVPVTGERVERPQVARLSYHQRQLLEAAVPRQRAEELRVGHGAADQRAGAGGPGAGNGEGGEGAQARYSRLDTIGSRTRNTVPLSTSLRTLIVPPWFSTMPCTIDSPSPVPLP